VKFLQGSIIGRIDMTFSVVIPVYNVAPYLRECMDSLLAQSAHDWEAICVDDGSTDGSGDVLDDYARRDGRFKVFHLPNQGVAAARNFGIGKVNGEWIWFVDGDDTIHPKALEQFSRDLERHSDAITISVPYVSAMTCDWAQRGEIEPAERVDGFCVRSFLTFFCGTCGQLIRRDALGDLRFEMFKRNEDGVFMMQVYWRGAVHLVGKTPFYFYRQRKTSAVHVRPTVENVASTFASQHKMIDVLQANCATHSDVDWSVCWQRLHKFCFYTYCFMYFELSSTDRGRLLKDWLDLQRRFVGLYPIRLDWRIKISLASLLRSGRLVRPIVLWRPPAMSWLKEFWRRGG